MKNVRDKHRRSMRLQGYDYNQAGAYFVTIVTQDRMCSFGDVADGKMQLNAAGQMIQIVWNELSTHYPNVETDLFVVMPNHVHGVIVLVGAGACAESGGQPRGDCPYKPPDPRITMLRSRCLMSSTDSKPSLLGATQ
jgi:hypothetical protein